MKKNKEKYVIIGNSIACISAIESIRMNDNDSFITVISKEPYPAYSRPLIPLILEGCAKIENIYLRDMNFYTENRVDLLLNQEVTKIIPEDKTVILKNKEKISYTKLLIASGGKPIIPQIEGSNRKDVYTFTSIDEILRLKNSLNKYKRVVVIGAGMIGLKAAETLKKAGLDVTVIELSPRILSSILDSEAEKIIRNYIEENGIEIITGNTVKKIIGIDKKVNGVILEDGRKIKTDSVILAIGVTPNLDIIKNSGIKIRKGILVNKYLQTNIENIYAAGDVIEVTDIISGDTKPIPLWPLAYEQGEIAGANMSGNKKIYEGALMMNSIELLNLPMITAGLSNVENNISTKFEILKKTISSKNIYKKIVIIENKIAGYILINQIDRAGIITGLIKEKIDVSHIKDQILEDNFGYISVPKEIRSKEILPVEI